MKRVLSILIGLVPLIVGNAKAQDQVEILKLKNYLMSTVKYNVCVARHVSYCVDSIPEKTFFANVGDINNKYEKERRIGSNYYIDLESDENKSNAWSGVQKPYKIIVVPPTTYSSQVRIPDNLRVSINTGSKCPIGYFEEVVMYIFVLKKILLTGMEILM